MQWNLVCIQNLELTHAGTKGAGCTACDSKNASVSNVACVCNINIIKILLQPHAKCDVSLKEG